ncbi:MAG: hypothetical protein DRP66_06330 [Planctomycetota bacterium]|nr:MAG: hypothetical protein DRP66_06330 [Planctomycetota bacterium]
MIAKLLAKLDGPGRRAVAVLVILAMICVCYYTIARSPLLKLRQSGEKLRNVRRTYAGAMKELAGLSKLKKRLAEAEQQLDQERQQCFTVAQASGFFESINTIALGHGLSPKSRLISKPRYVAGQDDQARRRSLATQSTKISVVGNYFDIVGFIDELTDRPQKVYIADLHINRTSRQDARPKATFNVIVMTDSAEI